MIQNKNPDLFSRDSFYVNLFIFFQCLTKDSRSISKIETKIKSGVCCCCCHLNNESRAIN
jgi:hypothetical protein